MQPHLEEQEIPLGIKQNGMLPFVFQERVSHQDQYCSFPSLCKAPSVTLHWDTPNKPNLFVSTRVSVDVCAAFRCSLVRPAQEPDPEARRPARLREPLKLTGLTSWEAPNFGPQLDSDFQRADGGAAPRGGSLTAVAAALSAQRSNLLINLPTGLPDESETLP